MASMSEEVRTKRLRLDEAAKNELDSDLNAKNELELNEHGGASLGTSMLRLYESQLWTDVTFKFRDQDKKETGEILKAHKLVLAARSPVFKAELYGDFLESQTDEILIDFDKETMDLFLRCLYSDEADLSEEEAIELMKVAHFYQVKHLTEFCATHLSGCLRIDNACALLDFSVLYDLPDLRDKSCYFIDKNAQEVIESDCFLEISKDCMTYLLKGDTFCTSEKLIFNKAIEWSRRACEKKGLAKPDDQMLRRALGHAFFYIRTPSMSLEDLVSCTDGLDVYDLQEYKSITCRISGRDGTCTVNSEKPRVPYNETVEFDREPGQIPRKPRIPYVDPLEVDIDSDEKPLISDVNSNLRINLYDRCALTKMFVDFRLSDDETVNRHLLSQSSCVLNVGSQKYKFKNLTSTGKISQFLSSENIPIEISIKIKIDYSLLSYINTVLCNSCGGVGCGFYGCKICSKLDPLISLRYFSEAQVYNTKFGAVIVEAGFCPLEEVVFEYFSFREDIQKPKLKERFEMFQ